MKEQEENAKRYNELQNRHIGIMDSLNVIKGEIFGLTRTASKVETAEELREVSIIASICCRDTYELIKEDEEIFREIQKIENANLKARLKKIKENVEKTRQRIEGLCNNYKELKNNK